MSYIRAGSNPEGLYIFGSEKDIEIYVERRGRGLHIPFDTFNTILKRWYATQMGYTDREKITYQGATLEWYMGKGELTAREFLDNPDPNISRWKFSYQNWDEEDSFYLYESTLFYLVVSNCERFGWKFPGRKETNEERCQRLGYE
jgi:hypothetical protein